MPKPRPTLPPEVCFMRHVNKCPDGCWLWTGAVATRGGGAFFHEKRTQRAHRVAYLLWIGEVPQDCVVTQTCKNILCVNPEHLRLETWPETNLRTAASRAHASRSRPQGWRKKFGFPEDIEMLKDYLRRGMSAGSFHRQWQRQTGKTINIRTVYSFVKEIREGTLPVSAPRPDQESQPPAQ